MTKRYYSCTSVGTFHSLSVSYMLQNVLICLSTLTSRLPGYQFCMLPQKVTNMLLLRHMDRSDFMDHVNWNARKLKRKEELEGFITLKALLAAVTCRLVPTDCWLVAKWDCQRHRIMLHCLAMLVGQSDYWGGKKQFGNSTMTKPCLLRKCGRIWNVRLYFELKVNSLLAAEKHWWFCIHPRMV